MDFIGSKIKLNKWIFNIIKNTNGNPIKQTFLDACSGSGAISQYAASIGYNVLSNDIMLFPSIITKGSIGLTMSQFNIAKKEIKRLNNLSGIEGYFFKNFCEESLIPRLYFIASNAKKIDIIRQEIDKIEDLKIKNYLLYCGLEAISRVSNTAGVQAAFLKKFKERAKYNYQLKEEHFFSGNISTFNKDIINLLSDRNFRNNFKEDILYIDPPYNQRQYAPNYHLYETFIKNDDPIANGKTGLREWKDCSSIFCSKKGLNSLKLLTELTTAKFVYISYNSDGLYSKEDFEKTFKFIKIYERDQRRYKSDISINRIYNTKKLVEYLFEIRVN